MMMIMIIIIIIIIRIIDKGGKQNTVLYEINYVSF
jgi:hypothetical protein